MESGFLFQALVYLSAAVLIVPLAKRLGLGSVLGYLLAGLVIGPSVLGWVGNDAEVMHVAEFGVVMMLFLIGLELEPKTLYKLRVSIIGLGGLQVVLSMLGISLWSYFQGFSWKEATALGMILALSSTAIVLQSLSEKGWNRLSAGKSAFSVLLFQDIAVIPILAILPLMVTKTIESSGHGAEWVQNVSSPVKAIIVLAAMALVVVIGRYIVGPLLRMVVRSGMRELFMATSLLLIAGIAFLMQQVELSPALGAFLAGVVLANSEFRHELESDIEPLKGLLLGLFFLSVGASIQLGFLSDHLLEVLKWVGALTMIKLIVLFILGKIFGLSTDQNFIFTFSLAQMGEFAFVLFTVTGQLELLSPETINLMTAVVALSMALTPILLLITEYQILPKVGTTQVDGKKKEYDEMDENNGVIIAGQGRVGSIITRFLRTKGVEATVVDNDSDRVELLRKYGFKVFYGDITRYDLLKAAGAEHAKIIILAMNSQDDILSSARVVKKYFPHLTIVSRSDSRQTTYELLNLGVNKVYPITLDASLKMGVDIMEMLGHRKYSAYRSAQKFRKHEDFLIRKLAIHRMDSPEYFQINREMINDLEQAIQNDMEDPLLLVKEAWDEEGRKNEYTSNKKFLN